MRFWDSSAVVPLLVVERTSATMRKMLKEDREMIVWWATAVECISALSRLEREAPDAGETVEKALDRLDRLDGSWHEVQPSQDVRRVARRLLRAHPLRAADALQLGAAVAASEHQPHTIQLVTLDDRLADAARREGFEVLP